MKVTSVCLFLKKQNTGMVVVYKKKKQDWVVIVRCLKPVIAMEDGAFPVK